MTEAGGRFTVALPASAPGHLATVLCLEIREEPAEAGRRPGTARPLMLKCRIKEFNSQMMGWTIDEER